MDKKKLIANGQLTLASAIWGFAFVAQRVGMGLVGPFTFGATRYLLGALTLYLVIRVMRMRGADMPITKEAVKGGISCGVFLFLGSTLQQIGLVYTTASKGGFITTLYIIIVPVLAGIIFRKKITLRVWVGVVLALVGLYLLSFSGAVKDINIGDVLVFAGAFLWAGHIFAIDHFVKKQEPLVLSMVQFMFASAMSTVLALLFETVEMQGILSAAIPILYAGIFSAGMGFTLQMMGQRHTDPTIASMILSLEAVFGAIGGFLLLNELMTARELFAFALIFTAIILAQLPTKKEGIIMNRTNVTLSLAITALLIALIFIGTYAIQIPMPFSQGGLIHAGDLVFFTVCLLFKPRRSAIAGAFGMGLFDLLSPYAIWAPFTFVIRLLMGFAIASVAGRGGKVGRNLLALIVGLPILIGGYYIAEAILYGNWIAPVNSIAGNFSQWLIGVAGSIPLSKILYSIPALKNMRD